MNNPRYLDRTGKWKCTQQWAGRDVVYYATDSELLRKLADRYGITTIVEYIGPDVTVEYIGPEVTT